MPQVGGRQFATMAEAWTIMCSPDLKVKAKKALEVLFSDDDDKEDKSRDKLKVMNVITGNNKFIEDGVISRANDLYVAKP